MTHAGEMQLEILPSLSRVIPFDDLEAWMQRADLCQPAPDATTGPLTLAGPKKAHMALVAWERVYPSLAMPDTAHSQSATTW